MGRGEGMIAEGGSPHVSKGARGIGALRKTCAGFGKNFSQGTSEIADVILDKSVAEKKEKFSKIKAVSWTFMKGLISGLKQDLKEVKARDLMADTSYELGKFSAAVQSVGGKLWNQITEKLDEDKKA